MSASRARRASRPETGRQALPGAARRALRRVPVPRLMRVRGRSMEPTLRDGDAVLALTGIPVRPGGVAVVRLPPDRAGAVRPLAVKRVTGRDPDDPARWWIDSDDPAHGLTSFDVGGLPEQAMRAVVVARLPRRRRRSPAAVRDGG
ncbi:MAG TPA: S24 family peptidase [Dermatophilaceae bacterium]|nr:S24 family peptidase [Dermatophilaceae bacterium]